MIVRQQLDGRAGWMFLIGTKKSSNEKSLKLENYKFGDILQGNFSDGYNYLPHKTIMSYIWINRFEKLGVTSKKKTVYLKTLSKQVGGWSRPCQNFFKELIFDIRWGQISF